MSHRDLYNDVVERIERTAALRPYRGIILYDWPEGDEHLTWVLSAQDVEILDWAQHVEMQAAMAEQRDAETTYRRDSNVEELAWVLPEEIEAALEKELGAIVHAPDYRCYEVHKGGSLQRSRFVGFDIEGAGRVIELRNVERDRWTITVTTDGEA